LIRSFLFIAFVAPRLGAAQAEPAPPPAPAPGHWPQWRGPLRDGDSTETDLLREWPKEGPKLLWKTTGLGEGMGCLSIAGGLIFVLQVCFVALETSNPLLNARVENFHNRRFHLSYT